MSSRAAQAGDQEARALLDGGLFEFLTLLGRADEVIE
jgi:hypothetical protein